MSKDQTVKRITDYVNTVKGHSNSSFNSKSTVNLYNKYIQEWSEYYLKS